MSMDIFRDLEWEGNSGPGSDPDNAAPYLDFVSNYIKDNAVQSVLDLGCGDGRLAGAMNWHGASYTGLDIKYGDNVLTCNLPQADLVLMKDVLQHWCNDDIQRMKARLLCYRQVLITNCCDLWRTNEDIPTGYARALNLSLPPFNWPVKEVFRWHGDETKSVVTLVTGS